MSQEQTEQYFADKAQEDDLATLAHKIHIELFPEEYDHTLDSYVDAKDRENGINPMSKDHIQRRDALREELGFAAYNNASDGPSTSEWVRGEVKEGKQKALLELIAARRRNGTDY